MKLSSEERKEKKRKEKMKEYYERNRGDRPRRILFPHFLVNQTKFCYIFRSPKPLIRNQVKHSLLILISLLLLSSPVIGQSSKYESVAQCVLQTMEDRKLTGNKMFEMVKEECERVLGKGVKKGEYFLYYLGDNKEGYKWKLLDGTWDEYPKYQGQVKNDKPNGLGILIYKDGKKYEGGWKDGKYNGLGTYTNNNGNGKYEGKWKNGKRSGQGTQTYYFGSKYVGSWKDGKTWNGIEYDKDGNIEGKVVNGERVKQ